MELNDRFKEVLSSQINNPNPLFFTIDDYLWAVSVVLGMVVKHPYGARLFPFLVSLLSSLLIFFSSLFSLSACFFGYLFLSTQQSYSKLYIFDCICVNVAYVCVFYTVFHSCK